MSTRRIGNLPGHGGWARTWPTESCQHKEHHPDPREKRDPGIYEHTCPGCGLIRQFTVERTFRA